MKFSEVDLSAIGQEVQLVGGIWAGNGKAFLFYFPEYGEESQEPISVEMTQEDWQALLRQSDLVETEVLAKSESGDIVKAVIRKCQRSIDQQATWNVYRRDGYRCRYCGADKLPLTVDHLVLWEAGGPTIESNLVSACRKCNKTRGRLPYEEWLRHPFYRAVSRQLSLDQREANVALASTLAAIPRMFHVRSR